MFFFAMKPKLWDHFANVALACVDCRWLETCNTPLWIVFWDCGDLTADKPTRISDVALLEGGPDTGFVLWRVVLLVPSLV